MIKLIFAIITIIITVIAYIPYFRDIFRRQTKPHLYTWLIWAITQGTASFASLYGGGKFGAISLFAGATIVFIIFLLSFKYGTKNITKSDTFVLILALLAIVIWWQLKNPLISVIMVSLIDGLGYIPTIRKTLKDPLSETTLFWLLMALGCITIILSSAQYNLLTITYPAVLAVANTIMLIICMHGIKKLKLNDQIPLESPSNPKF